MIRAALEEMRCSFSKAKVLAKHARPETEAELLEACAGQSERATRTLAKELAEEIALIEATKAERAAEAQAAEGARGGESAGARAASSVPAIDLITRPAAKQGPDSLPPLREGELAALMKELAQQDEYEGPAGDAPEDAPLPDSPNGLDTRIRELMALIDARDVWLGRVLNQLCAPEVEGWKVLGYASLGQYARERLGMSERAMKEKMRLGRETETLKVLEEAVVAGRLGITRASLVMGVATPETEAAWVERAERRTYKHLREDVDAAKLRATVLKGTQLRPPSEVERKAVQMTQRAMLSGELIRKVLEAEGFETQMSDGAAGTEARACKCLTAPGRSSPRPRRTTTRSAGATRGGT